MSATEYSRYKVLESDSIVDLELEINNLVAEGEGWGACGGICVESDETGDFIYFQAVSRN